MLDLDRLKAIPEMNIWLAHWGIDSPSLDCTMWQFGAVEIEDEEYDGNVYYSDYSVKKTTILAKLSILTIVLPII